SLLLSLRALVQKLYMTARNTLVACPTFNSIALIKDKLWRQIKVRVETITSPSFKTFHIRSNHSYYTRIFYVPRQPANQRTTSTLVPPLISSRLSRTSCGDISKCAWKRLLLRCSKPFIYAAIAVPLNGSFTDPVNKRFNAQSRRAWPYNVCGVASPRSRCAA